MSAEVEAAKEDEPKNIQQKHSLKHSIKEYWQIGIKLLELLLCALCIGLAADPVTHFGLGSSHMNHIGIMSLAFVGYFIINLLLIINRYFGERLPYKTASIYSMIGAALTLLTGILLTVDRSYIMRHYGYKPDTEKLPELTTTIALSFVNTVAFTVDAILTFRRMDDF